MTISRRAVFMERPLRSVEQASRGPRRTRAPESPSPLTAESAQCAVRLRRHEVLCRPPVEVVLRHARLRELLPAVVLARGQRAEERVAADLLVAARVVDLVELVAAAELGADRVPQELHQLDPAHGVDA